MSSKPKRSKYGKYVIGHFPDSLYLPNEGCETCRGRKVKCDEKHPSCSECTRLRLECEWFSGERPSIKRIRRGYGPVKSRGATWTPNKIAPTPSEPNFIGSCQVIARTEVSSSPDPSWSNNIAMSDIQSGSDHWWQNLGVDDEASMLDASPFDMLGLEDFQNQDLNSDLGNLEQLFATNTPTFHHISDSIRETVPELSLSSFHMSLPNSLVLSPSEHEALKHYQTTYSLYRTTKDPNWSTHKVLLHIGSQNTMIMHFLLAASINDYCFRSGQASLSQQAESHFQAGAQLLIGTMRSGVQADTVIMMAAFFFIYLYMSKRKLTAPQRLSQLSSTVSDFVQRQDLVTCCTNLLPSVGQSQIARRNSSSHRRSLLARLLMWTLDEDVKCSFQGTGGQLARYLSTQSTKDIYDASRNALGDHWGTEYPHSQILDDDQNSAVLEFLWALTPLWQDINDLSREPSPEISEPRFPIEQKFAILEEVCNIPSTV
jgi:hypothetical protein